MLDLGPIKERVKVTLVARSCVAMNLGCKPCEAALLEGADDVPALIAEVERLREALEVEHKRSDRWRSACPEVVADTDGWSTPSWMIAVNALKLEALAHDARRAAEASAALRSPS